MPTNFSNPFALTTPTGLTATTADGAYSDNMWGQLESLVEPEIQMQLARKWKTNSIWRAFNTFKVAMKRGDGSTPESIKFKGVFDMEPTVAPIGLYQIWLPNNYTDTWEQTITFKHYGDKVALHKYDDMVQAYRLDNKGGMINLARTLLGDSTTVFMDTLIRNAYLSVPNAMYANGHTDFSGFNDATAADHFDPAIARDVWMNLQYNNVPLATNPLGNGTNGTMICITTPSVIHDIQAAAGSEWETAYMHANPMALLPYEVGMYKNVRFIANARNVLWNTGDIIAQTTLAANVAIGDGASDSLVDNVYSVGQDSSIVTNGVTVTLATGFAVNQIVTLHKTQTNTYGVTGGVDFREPTARRRRIVKIVGNVLYFDRPLFHEFTAGDFVTYAQDIHPSIFVAGPETVATGVGEPIRTYAKDPVDDLNGIYRFSWDGYFETQLFRPETAIISYSAGTKPSFGIAPVP